VVQAFLIVTMFTTYAFQLALELTSALTLIPYLLVAAYGLKLAYTGETYEKDPGARNKETAGRRNRDLLFAADDLLRLASSTSALGADLTCRRRCLFWRARKDAGKQSSRRARRSCSR